MRHRALRRGTALLAGACVLAASACGSDESGGLSPDASVTPPPASPIRGTQPVLAVDIVQGLQEDPVEVAVAGEDGVAVTFREITISAGTGTTMHCNHGQLIGVVKQGQITHYSESFPGGSRTFRAGQAIVEDAKLPHEAFNEGTEDVVLMVTYVTPVGEPLVETDLSRCEAS